MWYISEKLVARAKEIVEKDTTNDEVLVVPFGEIGVADTVFVSTNDKRVIATKTFTIRGQKYYMGTKSA